MALAGRPGLRPGLFRGREVVWVAMDTRSRDGAENRSEGRPRGRLCMGCSWGISMTVRYRESREEDEAWKDEPATRSIGLTYCSHPGIAGEDEEPLEIEGEVTRCQGFEAYEEPVEAPKRSRKKRERRARRGA